MAKEYWVKCKIEPGMFPNERTIYIIDASGEIFVCFVHEGRVDEANKLSKVHIFSADKKYALVGSGGWTSCRLTVIKVLRSQIVEKEVPDL